ncbi:MAG TPA: hypothetical protein PLW37_08750 [bacterium]|nr:hypothetical protein [bacterium]HQB09944.1 hypothetical protein [bacterium]
MFSYFKVLSFFKVFLFVAFMLISGGVSAQMGPEVSVDSNGKILKWEEGSRDYFVMYKSVLLNLNQTKCLQDCQPGQDKAGNPQADACVDPNVGTTFTLMNNHIPSDAHIEAAYLVWTTAVERDKFDAMVDNSVTLTFTGKDGNVTHSAEITGPEHYLDESDGFTYEGKRLEFPLMTGYANPYKTCNVDADCHETIGTYSECVPYEGKTYCGLRQGSYTYRIDVTDFFETIHELGRDAGISVDGFQLLGNYNVSGIPCTNSSHYLDISGMIGGWSIIMVYTSEKIFPKKIYIYDDLDIYQFQYTDINVAGFELPTDANVKITLHTLEGDPGLTGAVSNPHESLQISGAQTFDWVDLQNICNPGLNDTLGKPYTEIYNSISSVYGWEDELPFCIGDYNDPNSLEYSMDVDTFLLKASDPLFEPHLIRGDTNLWVKVSSNLDGVYTNYMVLSIDTRAPKFDIPANAETPDGREKNVCSCSLERDYFCMDSAMYFLIKVQNWGDNASLSVKVKDALPTNVDYVPGTAQIATQFDSDGNGTDWKKVEDAGEGGFPFAEPYLVADVMEPCDQVSQTCLNTVLVRFKVMPKEGLPKNAVITNTAEITDSTGIVYYSNTSVPLRLKNDAGCDTECKSPTLEVCGGSKTDGGDSGNTGNSGDSGNTGDTGNTGDSGKNDNEEELVEDENVGCGCTVI